MKDDYVHLFVKRPVRRSPIINRGRFEVYLTLQFLVFHTYYIDGCILISMFLVAIFMY